MLRTILAALPLLAASPADAAFKAPCRPDNPGGATCTFWPAKVKAVDDGDTIKVHVVGEKGKQDVRFTGINAPELTKYSHTASERRGPCHGTEAAAFVDAAIRGHRDVRLAAQHASSRSGRRIRRSVWVKQDGVWRDLAKLELEAGLALWLPNTAEWAHNRQYEKVAAASLVAQRGIYDPDACGAGPDDDIPIRVTVNWDANGNDDHNLKGEYVTIHNDGDRDLSLAGWFLRDSALRKRGPVLGYPFGPLASVRAHDSVEVRVGCGTSTLLQRFWCLTETVFENVNRRKGAGDGAYLFDGHGDLRAARLYPCMLRCYDALKGKIAIRVHPHSPESITISNPTAEEQDLGGHVLKLNYRGRMGQYVFGRTFPNPAVLPPGGSYTYRPKPKSLPNHGGVVELRSDDDILTACDDWGFGRCGRAPKPHKRKK